jgi:hypothetical protein
MTVVPAYVPHAGVLVCDHFTAADGSPRTVGLQMQGFPLDPGPHPQGWRVNVRRAGADAIIGSGWDALPWRSLQEAGWEALKHHETAF